MAIAVATGIVIANDRALLIEYGGHISITKSWGASLYQRIRYVKHKSTTKSVQGISEEQFQEKKAMFLNEI